MWPLTSKPSCAPVDCDGLDRSGRHERWSRRIAQRSDERSGSIWKFRTLRVGGVGFQGVAVVSFAAGGFSGSHVDWPRSQPALLTRSKFDHHDAVSLCVHRVRSNQRCLSLVFPTRGRDLQRKATRLLSSHQSASDSILRPKKLGIVSCFPLVGEGCEGDEGVATVSKSVRCRIADCFPGQRSPTVWSGARYSRTSTWLKIGCCTAWLGMGAVGSWWHKLQNDPT